MDSSGVFLSFRREDTGKTFVSHLCHWLDRKGIRFYTEESRPSVRGMFSDGVERVIRRLNAAIIVISKKYASSVSCLNALAEIIESRRLIVLTVFYEVDPGDLTRPTGKFANNLRRHEKRENPETVNRWRNALERLENSLPRFCSRDWKDDSNMIDFISSHVFLWLPFRETESGELAHMAELGSTSDLESSDLGLMSDSYMKHIPESLFEFGETELESNELPYPASDDSNGLVGMYRHKNAVYSLLDLGSKNNVCTVGIWGIQGVGKTTLVECIFEDISRHFQHHCFLTNVNSVYQNRVSPSLLNHLTRTRSSDDIFDAIKPNLVNRNVLLVVEGVDDTRNEQFKDVMKVSQFLDPGSRVIMTSRDEKALVSCGVKYKMECLRYEEALQLFSIFAFKKTYPLIGFEGYSGRAVHFAGRLPLALKVLGSFLYKKDKESWKRTLRKLEASQDNGSRQVSNYIWAGEYLTRHPIELEQYVIGDEEEHSSSYHMKL